MVRKKVGDIRYRSLEDLEAIPRLGMGEVINDVCWWSEAREAMRGSKLATLEVSASACWKDAVAIARERGRTAAVW
jgi:hypothetical protein